MDPRRLMTTPVTVTRSLPVAWSTDRLGRPDRVETSAVATVCRLVRDDAPHFDAARDGVQVTVWKVFLPAGTGLVESDVLAISGRVYRQVSAPQVLATPLGDGYELATCRLIEDAT